MKFYNDVLSKETYDLVIEDIKSNIKKNVWTTSAFWEERLTSGAPPSCAICHITDIAVHRMITKELVDKLPTFNNLRLNYHLWGRGSNINSHDDLADSTRVFGGTLYLNKEWDIDFGGLFIWQDSNEEWKVHFPTCNSMVINDEGHRHLVTPISYDAPEFRISLQIWGEKIV